MRVEMDCVIIGICDGMGIVMIELVIVQNRVTVISAKIINYKQPNIPIELKSRRDRDKRRIFNLDDVGGGPRDVRSKTIYYRYIWIDHII